MELAGILAAIKLVTEASKIIKQTLDFIKKAVKEGRDLTADEMVLLKGYQDQAHKDLQAAINEMKPPERRP